MKNDIAHRERIKKDTVVKRCPFYFFLLVSVSDHKRMCRELISSAYLNKVMTIAECP